MTMRIPDLEFLSVPMSVAVLTTDHRDIAQLLPVSSSALWPVSLTDSHLSDYAISGDHRTHKGYGRFSLLVEVGSHVM